MGSSTPRHVADQVLELCETLRSAADLCEGFRSKAEWRKWVFHAGHREKFSGVHEALDRAMQTFGLAIQVGQEERRVAEEEDRAQMISIFMELQSSVVEVGGAVDEVGAIAVENNGLLADQSTLLTLVLSELNSLKNTSSALYPKPGPALGWEPSEPWRISPKELAFDKEEDDFGEMTRVELGKGGFGAVFKGRFRGQGVAIKQIRMDSDKIESEFRREVAISSKLSHRNIIACFGGCILKKDVMLVTELCMGSLSDAIHRNKSITSMDDKWRCCRQVSRGLAYLHGNGVVHRDVKPDNVLFDAHNTCKIIDFGLASTRSSSRASAAQSTMAGANTGTHSYMAPELFGAGGGRPVDVYVRQ
jgi:predicted Ser/Thr protein kinase